MSVQVDKAFWTIVLAPSFQDSTITCSFGVRMQSSPGKVKGDLSWPSLPKCFPIAEMEADGRVSGPVAALSAPD